MKIEQEHRIGLFDIDYQFKPQVQSIARLFQECSTFHSDSVGAGTEFLIERGLIWFLNRIEIEFFRYPKLFEDVKVITWSRGFKRFKGFREYLMTSPAGDIARGTSVWIFFDVKRNRISKIPQDILDCYHNESEKWFADEIDAWKPCGKISPENQMDFSLRYSDFDVNGHVNNTIYFSFLETLYHQSIKGLAPPVKNVKIRYNSEIDQSKKSVRAGWQKSDGSYLFNIFDDSNLYADGEITPMG